MTRRARTRASVRFDPYYKLQWYDPVRLAWRDARGRFPTAEEARAAAPAGRPTRVSEITMDGRTLIGEG